MRRALLLAGVCAIVALPAFAQAPSNTVSPNAPNGTPQDRSQAGAPPAANSPSNRAQSAPSPNAPGGSSPGAANSNARGGAANTENAGQAPSTADFVKNAAIGGLFEIESSRLALRKHARSDRRFAERMIRDHGRLAAQLKHIVRADHVDVQLPTKLDSKHQQMLDKLRQESGQDFDKDYGQMQQQGHQETVSLFESYAQSGDNPALKRWAQRALPELKDHLSMAQKLSS